MCLSFDAQDLPDAIDLAYEDGIHDASKADALSVGKAGGNREADVDLKDPENKSCKDNEEESSELLQLLEETASISEEERKQSLKDLSGCVGSQ